jgi:hypothetical protein
MNGFRFHFFNQPSAVANGRHFQARPDIPDGLEIENCRRFRFPLSCASAK